jgi:hypothetical protein
MRLLCALLVLSGMAMGQQLQPRPPEIPCHIGDKFILSGHQWDCVTEDTILPEGWSRWMPHLDSGGVVTLENVTGLIEGDPCDHMDGCVALQKKAEPENVPAIVLTKKTKVPGLMEFDWHDVTVSYHTCADKTRILLHDEQDPPVYWCHKVNTGAEK